MIRLLQLSDIHFHHEENDEDYYAHLKDCLEEDLRACVQNTGPIDNILICGDIAFSGKKEEYQIAGEFIDKLKEITHAKNVYTVPGNHDVNRDSYDTLKANICNHVVDKASDFVSKSRTKEPLALKACYMPMINYYQFASKYHISEVATKFIIEDKNVLETKDKLFCIDDIGNIKGYLIRLVGMNSCLISDSKDIKDPDDSEGHLQALPKQMWGVDWSNNIINISMVHHPLKFIKYGANIQKTLDERFQVQLFGHEHIQNSETESTIRIHSGALQPPQREVEGDPITYAPVYNVIEIDVNDENKLEVSIYSRKWSDGQFVRYEGEGYVDGCKRHCIMIPKQDSWTKTAVTGATVNDVYLATNDGRLQVAAREFYSLKNYFRALETKTQVSILKEMFGPSAKIFTPSYITYYLFQISRYGLYDEFKDSFIKVCYPELYRNLHADDNN